MKKRSISDYLTLANNLLDVGWFNPDRLKDGASLFIVEDFQDAIPIDDADGAAVFFETDDENKIAWFKPLFDDFPLAFVLIPDKAKCEAVSGALTRLFPEVVQYLPKEGAFGAYTKLRDYLDSGEKALDNLLLNTVQKPAYGLINLAKIQNVEIPRIALSGIRSLDKMINGFGAGELSVWTGTRGSGKSTLISEILLNAIDQDVNVFAYSGELTAASFFRSAVTQAAGGKHTRMEIDPHSGKEYYLVDSFSERQIKEWLDGRFFLYDNNIADANNADSILSVMGLGVHRYGCKMFLVDNLMTARFGRNDRDFYREQSEFVGRLVEFAKKSNVHVHLVAHPRKAGEGQLTADDVGGSGDITNRADNVFSIKRVTEDGAEFDAGLTIIKNRRYGAMGKIKLDFDKTCNRFYEDGTSPNWRYGWDIGLKEIQEDDNCPF